MAVQVSSRTKKILSVLVLPVPAGSFLLSMLVKERLPKSYAQWMMHKALSAQSPRQRVVMLNRLSSEFPRLELGKQPHYSIADVYREIRDSRLSAANKRRLTLTVPTLEKQFRVAPQSLSHFATAKEQLKLHKLPGLSLQEHADIRRRLAKVGTIKAAR
jgi:hypothetical protein